MLSITVNTLIDEQDNDIDDGDISLRDAIAFAGTAGLDNTINFSPTLNNTNKTINLALGEIAFSKSLTIDASMLSSGITINASMADLTPDENNGDGIRIFNITGSSTTLVTMKGLTLTAGM